MKPPALICALFCLFVAPQLVSAQTHYLADMQRIGIVIDDLDTEEKNMGLTRESLTDVVLLALKRDVPKLTINEDSMVANNDIYVRITSSMVDQHNVVSFVEVSILRPAAIAGDSGAKVLTPSATVWSRGKLLGSPLSSMRSHIRDYLNQAVTEFAAQYNKDNP